MEGQRASAAGKRRGLLGLGRRSRAGRRVNSASAPAEPVLEGGARRAPAPPARDDPGAAPAPAAGPAVELLEGYASVVAAAVDEIARCGAGDSVTLSSYVVEPGASTEAVLDALGAAARRGVALSLRVDCSMTSAFTRTVEGTTSLAPRLEALAAEHGEGCVFEPCTVPTHAKYLLCRRAAAEDSVLFGGVNLGDRFASWRDFGVRCVGAGAVDALEGALQRTPGAPAAGREARFHVRSWTSCRHGYWAPRDVRFVANRPAAFDPVAWAFASSFPGTYELEPTLEGLLTDEALREYRVATPYIDAYGARLLGLALGRGASVDLVVPETPNVYGSCNLHTLEHLLRRYESGGQLRVHLHPDMIHAKALVGRGDGGVFRATLGSCNLKRRSFTQFEELNASVPDPRFGAELWDAVGRLHAESMPVCTHLSARVRHNPLAALIQEHLG